MATLGRERNLEAANALIVASAKPGPIWDKTRRRLAMPFADTPVEGFQRSRSVLQLPIV